MGNSIGTYKNPLDNQYICPDGWHFMCNGVNVGRVIWTCSPEGYYTEKDEENQ